MQDNEGLRLFWSLYLSLEVHYRSPTLEILPVLQQLFEIDEYALSDFLGL